MKRFVLLFALCTLLPPALRAQQTLSLDECLQRAAEHNRRIAAARAQTAAADREARAMRANFLPSLSLTGTALYSTADGGLKLPGGMLPVFDAATGTQLPQTAYFPGVDLKYDLDWIYNAGVLLEQPLFMGGKVRTGYRMARVGSALARENRRLTESEVIVGTSRAYADVVKARGMERVAAQYKALVEELLRNVRSACNHGLRPQNDVLRVEVKLGESELNLRCAQNAVRLASMNLCHWVGLPLDTPVELSDELPVDGGRPEGSVEDRPEYRMLDRQTQLAALQLKLARGERLPQVAFVGSYGYSHGVALNGQNLLGSWNFMAGFNVSIPIFHFGARTDKVRAARARYEQTRLEGEEKAELLALEMTRSSNNYDEAALELQLSETTVRSADENLRISKLRYESGSETLSDYLESQALWQSAHESLVNARVALYLRRLELSRSLGRLR